MIPINCFDLNLEHPIKIQIFITNYFDINS